MKTPAFWSIRPPNALARILQPVGMLYGAATLQRMRRAGARAALPVICIGNFTAGGAGKTPTALALAAALQAMGERPVFLSRGYGGSLTVPTRVDPATHHPAAVGDEPLLLARAAPTIVAADRVAGVALAATSDASVILLDDGMQSPALAKGFTLAVVDGGSGFGNGLCVPAGPLRAPAIAQAGHVDALLAIGFGAGAAEAAELGRAASKPVHRTDFVVGEAMAERLAGQRVLAFAGIGRPAKFFDTLAGLYAKIEVARPFADHHPFTDADARALLALARTRKLLPVTTEKDMIRLTGSPALAELASEAVALPVRLTLPQALVDAVMSAISAARRP